MNTAREHVSPVEGLRIARGLSQGEAADLIGVDKRTLRDIELGHKWPITPTVFRIAKFYEVNPIDLTNAIRAFYKEGD